MHPKIIENLKNYYRTFENELKAYTQEGVSSTPYAAIQSNAPRPTWAEILLDIIDLDKQKKLAEFERTMTARYCFELLLMASTSDEITQKEAHKQFIAAQKDQSKMHRGDQALSINEFYMWVDHFNTKLNHDPLAKTLVDYLVVYSDLAKTPTIKAWAKAHGIPADLGGDEIMRQILNKRDEEIQEILPSFANLTDNQKTKLRLYYPLMTACIGHLLFLEAGPKMLESIHSALKAIPNNECQMALNTIIGMAQMLDMMGARGQENIEGSLTFTHNMHLGACDMLKAIRILDNAENIRSALENYLQRRVNHMGYNNYKTIYPTEAHSESFMRLACKLRVFDTEKALALKNAFDTLSQENRDLLARELSFSEKHGIDSFLTAPNYEATGFHNITKTAREITHDYAEEMRLALNYSICFAKIVEAMQEIYPDVCQSMNPVSFGKLAFLANEYPNFFNPETFLATAIIAEEQLRTEHVSEFVGKSLVELTLPNNYKKPEIKYSIAASLANSLSSITNLNSGASNLNNNVISDKILRHRAGNS